MRHRRALRSGSAMGDVFAHCRRHCRDVCLHGHGGGRVDGNRRAMGAAVRTARHLFHDGLRDHDGADAGHVLLPREPSR